MVIPLTAVNEILDAALKTMAEGYSETADWITTAEITSVRDKLIKQLEEVGYLIVEVDMNDYERGYIEGRKSFAKKISQILELE